jgi:predicted AlkP superfamily pyrophosphatase or phosphodiesterase
MGGDMPEPLVIINAVGLTSRYLANAPHLAALANKGWRRTFREVLPAVTCTAQATLLTGKMPDQHGIVANGWLFRDTNEVRFWQQSNRLIEAEPIYATAKRRAVTRGRSLKIAKFFWWFNQGAAVDLSVTPKPHNGIDGRKAFDISTAPPELRDSLVSQLGPFPFTAFWGPMAGLKSSKWIAAAAAVTLLDHRPDLVLVYLPHLDYDPQRFGPSGCDMARLVRELDEATVPLLDAAKALGARVWVVSEYGHHDVITPIFPNRALRNAGLLAVRPGPFGEQLDLYGSQAFAVCDHQLAHIYVRNPADVPRVTEIISQLPGVDRVLIGDQRNEFHLSHARSGEIVALAKPEAWFAYPFWLDDRFAPDFACCVAIHSKPGFDPCELFFEPGIRFPRIRVARKLLQQALGFRMTMDMIPLDASIVHGSHGLTAPDDIDRPIWIGDGPPPSEGPVRMTGFRVAILNALGLPDE